jgi:prepilin-type N-terminal cleavage/methylation domain-containing protein/prepilin-type processing-associated H-X9-DG protein
MLPPQPALSVSTVPSAVNRKGCFQILLPAAGRAMARARWGFTLVELLVVIGILGVLAALLIPALSSMAQRSNMAKSSSNLRQIATALVAYAGDHAAHMPPAKGWLTTGELPAQQLWWAVHLLPYTGRSTKIFDRPGLTKTWDSRDAVDPVTGRQFRIGYWINAGNDANVAFGHSGTFIDKLQAGKNYLPTIAFSKPARTVALIDGIGGMDQNLWNPDSRGMWRSGSNSKYHRWSGEKVDQNGLTASGQPPEGDFNVLWLDGHVSLENSASLKTEDFLRIKP